MSDEIVNRLRTDATTRQLCELAADEITALRAKVKRQAEALKPFADLAQHLTSAPDDGWLWRGEEPLEITVGDLRRAAQEATNEVE